MSSHATIALAFAVWPLSACNAAIGIDGDYRPLNEGTGGDGNGGNGGNPGAGGNAGGGNGGNSGAGGNAVGGAGGGLPNGVPCNAPSECASGMCEAGECCSDNCQ